MHTELDIHFFQYKYKGGQITLPVFFAPRDLKIDLQIKVGWVLKNSGSSLFDGHQYFWFVTNGCLDNCQALVPSPVPLDPKPTPNLSKIKIQVQLGLGWHNNPMGHHHHPLTFNHEEVLKGKSANMEKVSGWPPKPIQVNRWTRWTTRSRTWGSPTWSGRRISTTHKF